MSVESALAVARLVSSLGKIEGRKRVQKIVFLLKSSGSRAFDQEFLLHYYGPFSRELAGQLDFLCQAGLIEEELEGDTYTYTPTVGEGRKPRIDELSGERGKPDWFACSQSLAQKDTNFLEALSTFVYLHTKHSGEDRIIKKQFRQIKPGLQGLLPEVECYAEAESWV